MGLVGGFTAVKPSDDHLIRDAGGHRIAPDAAEVVVVRRLNVGVVGLLTNMTQPLNGQSVSVALLILLMYTTQALNGHTSGFRS